MWELTIYGRLANMPENTRIDLHGDLAWCIAELHRYAAHDTFCFISARIVKTDAQ